MRDAGARGFDHQRLRMAVQRGDDDLLDGVIDRRIGIDHLLQAIGERADQAVGQQHAHEGADQRGADHPAEDRRRLVDRSHRLHHAEHGRDDAQRGQRVAQGLQRGLRALHLVVVGLDRIVHHLLDGVDIERARRDDDEAERIRDQVDERVIGEQARIFGEDGRRFGILDMRLEGDRPVGGGRVVLDVAARGHVADRVVAGEDERGHDDEQ